MNRLIEFISNRKMVFILLFILAISLKIPSLNTPYIRDELGNYYIPTNMVLTRGFNPFFGNIDLISHPPLFFEIFALVFYIFGSKVWIAHLFIAIFSFLAVYFTYLLGKKVYNPIIGLLAALFLFFSPLFFAQSAIMQPENFLAFLSVITVYFYLKNKTWLYIFFGSLLVLSKEPGILIIGSIVLYELVICYKKRHLTRSSTLLLIPFFIFILWLILSKWSYGWFFHPTTLYLFSLNIFKQEFFNRFKQIFLINHKIFLTLAIITFSLPFKKIANKSFLEKWGREIFLFIIIVSVVTLFFSFIAAGFQTRYLIFAYPFFFIMSSRAVYGLVKKRALLLIVSCIFILLFINQGYTNAQMCDSCEDNMNYREVALLQREACQYIEKNYKDPTVLTSTPLGHQLSFPEAGYTSKRQKTIMLEGPKNCEYNPQTDGKFNIIYYYLGTECSEKLEEIIKNENLRLAQQLVNKGIIIQIWDRGE